MLGIVTFQIFAFMALAVIWGALCWTLILPDEAKLDPLGSPLCRQASFLLLPSVLLRTWNHAWTILGEYEGPIWPALVAYVKWTPQGKAGVVMAAIAGVLMVHLVFVSRAWPARLRALSVLPLCLVLAGSQAAQGHALILRERILGVTVDGLHFLAVLVWIGGLFHLGIWLATGARVPLPSIERFSRLATVCVLTLLGTGLATYYLHFRTRTQPLETTWGLALMTKVAIFLGMLLLARRNRRDVRASSPPRPSRVLWELGLGAGALIVASIVTQLDPHQSL